MSQLSRRAAAAFVTFVAAALGACGSDQDPAVAPPDTSDTTPGPASSTSPSTSSTSTTPTVPTETFEVAGGAVTGGPRTVESPVGRRLLIVVRSDVADEVHLHGYDIHSDVAPGADAIIDVETTIPGQFEIELEDRKLRLGELRVR